MWAASARGDHAAVIRRIGRNDRDTRELCVGNIIKDRTTAAELAAALKGNTHVQYVTFREYSYDAAAFEAILEALKETKVQKIAVGPQSQVLHYGGKYALAVVRQVPSLQSLIRLDLNACNIGPVGAIILSAILAKENSTLRRLDLPDNDIGDEGAAALGHMLGRNNTLKEIILDTNGIGEWGQRALRNAVYDDRSFASILDCNHTLLSYFYIPRNVFGKTVLNDVLSSHAANLRSNYPEAAATKKLRRVLKKRYGATLQFEAFLDTETALLPHVLGWIAGKRDLDLMYSFKPMLVDLLEGRG